MLLPETHAGALPEALDDVTAAQLPCAGIVGLSGTAVADVAIVQGRGCTC